MRMHGGQQMENDLKQCGISEEDIRAGLTDLKGFVDITEEDLMKIYSSALRHARNRSQSGMTVAHLMTRDVVTVKKDTPLEEAARRLTGLRISGMPVVDDQDKVIGVIGELDIMSVLSGKKRRGFKDLFRRIMGEPSPVRKEGDQVGHVMSTPAITIKSSFDVRDAARVLDSHRIKRLPVVDDDGKLIGVISRADIVRAMGKTMEERTLLSMQKR
jgi:CBS-domain-containing membrane protein